MQKLISYYLNFRTFYFTSILIFIGLGWGLSFSITKIAVSSNDHPLTILLYQNIVCFLFLLIFYFFKFENFKLSLEAIKFYFLISISGVVIPGTLFFIAASKVPAGILSLSVSFVAGTALAYLLDPLADRLQRVGFNRLWAVIFFIANENCHGI